MFEIKFAYVNSPKANCRKKSIPKVVKLLCNKKTNYKY